MFLYEVIKKQHWAHLKVLRLNLYVYEILKYLECQATKVVALISSVGLSGGGNFTYFKGGRGVCRASGNGFISLFYKLALQIVNLQVEYL